MIDKKVLITGCSGMLGTELSENYKYEYDFLFTSKKNLKSNHEKLDITCSSNVKELFHSFKPDILINCAAYTDVDKAEYDKTNAYNANVVGLRNLIKYSSLKTKIVHISTDYVFNGDKYPYDEESNTFPLNYYGKTKLESENVLIGSNRNYIILRPNVLFDSNGNNFFTFVYKMLSNDKEINIVDDQISNPSYVPCLSNSIYDLILMDNVGIFHHGSKDSISRYEFAMKIAKIFNFNTKLINKVNSSFFSKMCNRPRNSTLTCSKLLSAINCELNNIDQSLEDIKRKYEK